MRVCLRRAVCFWHLDERLQLKPSGFASGWGLCSRQGLPWLLPCPTLPTLPAAAGPFTQMLLTDAVHLRQAVLKNANGLDIEWKALQAAALPLDLIMQAGVERVGGHLNANGKGEAGADVPLLCWCHCAGLSPCHLRLLR